MKDEHARAPKSSLRVAARLVAHLVFWGWNAIFLAFTCFGIAPRVGVALLRETVTGLVPPSLAAALLLVVLVPAAATALGAVYFRRDPAKLFRLFYGVEVPLFLLAMGRLFLVRDLTPGVAFVIVATCVGVGAYLHDLVGPLADARGSDGARAGARALAGSAVGLVVAAYVAALLAFLAIPVGAVVIVGLVRFEWVDIVRLVLRQGPAAAVMILAAMVLFMLSATLFALAPAALIGLFVRRFVHHLRAASARVGRARAALVVAAVAALLVSGFAISVRQPQHGALAMMASPPADDAERRARLDAADSLRVGLLNAYLAPWRYLGSNTNSRMIHDLWFRSMRSSQESADRVQAAFNAVACPFVYDGDGSESARHRAGDLYSGFFDRSIQHGEKDAILAALEATYSRDDREAGLLAQGERKVHVARQEIRVVSERGAIAEIEIHEVYENQTFDPQEVLYFFSLPETAAITGLWLGETNAREEAFAFTVSPRGAAQRVYRAEVAKKRDPALVEQVGPRQYRLRAYPIPARERPRGDMGDVVPQPGRTMHLWMRYRTLIEGGRWPLPNLVEARNAYRDRRTGRFLDGQPRKLAPEVWLPSSLPAGAHGPASELRARLGDGTVIVARPAPAPAALPRGLRLAIVIDRSYSMRPHAERVAGALGWIRDHIEPDNDVDLYLTAAPSRGEPPQRIDDPRAIDPAAIVYYGGQDPADLLAQLDALRGDTRYDGIVVLTDEGGFDLAGPKQPARDLGAPVWMVHLGGTLAPGYDDATLATIQARGGGATTTVESAFARLGDTPHDPRDLGWADGHRWTIAEGGEGPFDTRFAALAAHRWIPIAARSAGLDGVHRVAREAGVVSPFSSMIVLVNDAQRKALAEAEARADRFERDTETGEARLSAPPPPLGSDLTGTPEPEEWILLGVAALGLAWAARRRAQLAALPA